MRPRVKALVSALVLRGAAAIGIVALSFNVLYVMGQQKQAEAVRLLDSGSYEEALRPAQSAAQLDRGNAYEMALVGLINERLFERGLAVPFSNLLDHQNHRRISSPLLFASRQFYMRALALNPWDSYFLHNLGWLYVLQGDVPRGTAYIDQAAERSHASMFSASAGLVREYAGAWVSAEERYETAVEIDPEILETPFAEALETRHPGVRARILQNAIEANLRHNDPVTRAKLGRLYMLSGEAKKAQQALSTALQGLPNLSRPWLYLAILSRQSNDRKDCYRFLRRAQLLADGRDADVWFELGEFSASVDQKAAATAYRQALSTSGVSQLQQFARRAMYRQAAIATDELIPSGTLAYYSPKPPPAAAALLRITSEYSH